MSGLLSDIWGGAVRKKHETIVFQYPSNKTLSMRKWDDAQVIAQ